MAPHVFKKRLQQMGLYVTNAGVEFHGSLTALAKEPQPLQPTRFRSKLRGAPSAIPQMGKLISAGFAQFEREASRYVITDAGRQWLAEVSAKIITPQNTTNHAQ